MLGRNVPLAEVAAYIGDSVETVVKVYAHFLEDAPKTAKKALEWHSHLRSIDTACGELVA